MPASKKITSEKKVSEKKTMDKKMKPVLIPPPDGSSNAKGGKLYALSGPEDFNRGINEGESYYANVDEKNAEITFGEFKNRQTMNLVKKGGKRWDELMFQTGINNMSEARWGALGTGNHVNTKHTRPGLYKYLFEAKEGSKQHKPSGTNKYARKPIPHYFGCNLDAAPVQFQSTAMHPVHKYPYNVEFVKMVEKCVSFCRLRNQEMVFQFLSGELPPLKDPHTRLQNLLTTETETYLGLKPHKIPSKPTEDEVNELGRFLLKKLNEKTKTPFFVRKEKKEIKGLDGKMITEYIKYKLSGLELLENVIKENPMLVCMQVKLDTFNKVYRTDRQGTKVAPTAPGRRTKTCMEALAKHGFAKPDHTRSWTETLENNQPLQNKFNSMPIQQQEFWSKVMETVDAYEGLFPGTRFAGEEGRMGWFDGLDAQEVEMRYPASGATKYNQDLHENAAVSTLFKMKAVVPGGNSDNVFEIRFIFQSMMVFHKGTKFEFKKQDVSAVAPVKFIAGMENLETGDADDDDDDDDNAWMKSDLMTRLLDAPSSSAAKAIMDAPATSTSAIVQMKDGPQVQEVA